MKPSALPEFRARAMQDYKRFGERIERAQTASVRDPNDRLVDHELVVERRDSNARIAEIETILREKAYGPPAAQSAWKMADLYYVMPEMANLAGQAADSMPEFELHPSDLPAPHGLIYFDHPFGERDLTIVSLWGPDYSGQGDVVTYTFSDQPDGLVFMDAAHIRYGSADVVHSDVEGQPDADGAYGAWLRILRCTWLLMQQQLATVTEVMPDRAAARRARRSSNRLDPVRVIALRRAASASQGDGSREWQHRWVVRGHWRKQWYASQDRHVPIWIAPFIKGPDDAPLLGGEKVYAWTR